MKNSQTEIPLPAAATMNSDEAKIENLMIKENFKVEKIPTIQGQAEETKREIYLEAAGDQEPCILLTNNNDHVTEMREVNELPVKLQRRDSGLLYHKESDEVGINDGMLDSIEPSTTTAVCDASNSTCDLIENGHYVARVQVAQNHHILATASSLRCDICIDGKPDSHFAVMDCGRSFYNECWTEHFTAKMSEGQGRRIKCIAQKCNSICDATKECEKKRETYFPMKFAIKV